MLRLLLITALCTLDHLFIFSAVWNLLIIITRFPEIIHTCPLDENALIIDFCTREPLLFWIYSASCFFLACSHHQAHVNPAALSPKLEVYMRVFSMGTGRFGLSRFVQLCFGLYLTFRPIGRSVPERLHKN